MITYVLHYCEQNNIQVKGIYREDYSARNFNRPEWTKLLNVLKNRKKKDQEHVLFIKWDRFSRNIEYAYQMIGLLRTNNVQAMAIDQPIDFKIPESTVMLAVYLAVPESENTRRRPTIDISCASKIFTATSDAGMPFIFPKVLKKSSILPDGVKK